jgi:hypothetical protein
MSLKQTVYFMALVGAIAGLCCWALQSWIGDFGLVSSQAQFTVIVTAIMGALIGGFTVGFADRWTSDRVVARWVAAGVVLGALAGMVGGLVYPPILSGLMQSTSSALGATLGRPLTWLIAGGLIGLVTGLRWFGVNRFRCVHALLGGLVGGGLGGLLFTFLGSQDFFQALAFMISGMGITLGVTLAPVLLRDGVLQFISSADPRAQNKYGSPQQEWVVQEGDRFVIGSQGSERNMTLYARAVDIYIPDAMVAKRHAMLFAKGKRFYIQQHPENIGPQGQPLSPLQVNNANVTNTRELRDQDEIIVGQTLLRFASRKQAAAQAQVPVGRRA